jgi:hypothetical protein
MDRSSGRRSSTQEGNSHGRVRTLTQREREEREGSAAMQKEGWSEVREIEESV